VLIFFQKIAIFFCPNFFPAFLICFVFTPRRAEGIQNTTLGANEPSEDATSAKFSHTISGPGGDRKSVSQFSTQKTILIGSYRAFPPAGPTLCVARP
jgi:hypothetical protein